MAIVLLVEDEVIMLKAIKSILSKDGHDVITAKDGREAFEKLDNEQYDVVVTDIRMPYANGLEVINKLRSNNDKRHIGIMVYSSESSEETITEAFRLGANDYLRKPISAAVLTTRVRQLLATHNSTTQLVTTKKSVFK